MTFICTDCYRSAVGIGTSLDEAHADYLDNSGEYDKDELTFYEATEIEVEFKVIKKETVTKKGK